MPRTTQCWMGILVLFSSACAAPLTQQQGVSHSQLVDEQRKQQAFTLKGNLEMQQRLDSVAFPLLRAATPLCGDRTGMRAGIHVATVESFDTQWQQAARDIGLSDTSTVTSVAAGSAAERAGVRVGDRLVAYNGVALPVGHDATRAFAKSVSAMQQSGSTDLTVDLRRNDEPLDIHIPMDRMCAFDAEEVPSSELNAFADGKTVYVTSAMMRFAASDDELATVVAHEIGHNAMRHMDAKKRNAGIGALFGAVLDVASASQGVNTGGQYSNQFAAMGAQKYSQSFENEADYVGLYILALAGRPLDQVPMFWRKMAQENPVSIKFASSHPTTAERFVRIQAAVEEIEGKEARGEPLRPELKSKN